MKRLLYFAMAALMVLAVSCKKNPNGTDPKVQEPSAKTLEANEIGAYSARLHAMIDFAGASRNGVSYGFIWGTSEDTEGTYSPGEGVLDKVNAYTAEIMGLSPETEYWYKAFVEIDGKPYSGDILKFTTAAKPDEPAPDQAVTVGSEQVSAVSAVLMGRAILATSAASDLMVGFQYSKSAEVSSENSMTIEASDLDAEYRFSAQITGLVPSTTYYFRSFIRQNGVDTYGETKSFTTKDVASVLETKDATDIEATSASLNAKLVLTDVKYDNISYGFYLGTSETNQSTNLNGGEISGNVFLASATGLDPKKQYWYKAYVTLDGQTLYGAVKSFTTKEIPITVPEFIDLGIVMTRDDGTTYKLYWATCNLCKDGFVSSPEVYGDYYAWGETETKEDYSWSTYKWCEGSSTTLTKYNSSSSYGIVDNKKVLETGPDGDDVASKRLGGNWRMPTDDEWTALRTDCTWTITSNYNNTGVKGMIVTSNIEGYKDKSIFLPTAGVWDGTELNNAGFLAAYWSSSVATMGNAWRLYFTATPYRGGCYRYCGQSVRPVYED